MLLGTLISTSLDSCYVLAARRHRLRTGHAAALPEFRLPFVVMAAFLPPAGLAAFAWAAHLHRIHWVLPLIGSVAVGAGMVMGHVGGITYLVESFGALAGPAMAVAVVMRSAMTAVFVVMGWYVYQKLGYAR